MRRSLLVGALAAVLGATAACGASAGGGEAGKTTIRFSWWGNADRAKITQQAVDLFEKKNPGVEVQPSFAEYEAYWQKMSTQVAGGGGPDVLQMDYSYIRQYAGRDLIRDLKPMADAGKLKLSGFRPGLAETGAIDGKQFGVPMGGNTFAVFYRPDVLDKAGVAAPKAGWSWDDYGKAIEKVTKAKVAEGMTGSGDYTAIYHLMDLWLRQQGKSFYTDAGKLGFTADELRTWFNQTKGLRDGKLLLSAQRAEQIDPQPPLSANAVAMEPNWDNFLARYAGEAPGTTFALAPVPSLDPAKPGLYLKPSMLLSVSARSKQPDLAAKLIDFLVNDPEAVKILGTNRGIPATEAGIKAVTLGEVDKSILAYERRVANLLSPPPPAPPGGAGTIEQAMRDISEEINFGRMTVDQAVDRFISEAEQALAAAAN